MENRRSFLKKTALAAAAAAGGPALLQACQGAGKAPGDGGAGANLLVPPAAGLPTGFMLTFFLFAFMCFPYLFIMWKWIPETTGKTLEEIENHWRKR